MTTGTDEDVSANLAFVKALVSEGGRAQMSGGAIFLAGGLCYGAQCLLNWADIRHWWPGSALTSLTIGIAPTVIFCAALAVILWRERRMGQKAPGGVATRAITAAFGSAGLANVFIMAVFAYNGIAEKSLMIWLFYPCMVCVLQGAVWFVAYMIRRKAWLAVVSGGWFVTTLALGLTIRDTSTFILILGFAMLILMAGSGGYMMKQAKAGD